MDSHGSDTQMHFLHQHLRSAKGKLLCVECTESNTVPPHALLFSEAMDAAYEASSGDFFGSLLQWNGDEEVIRLSIGCVSCTFFSRFDGLIIVI